MNLTITISGRPGSGKSTIAFLLKETLEKVYDIHTNIENEEPGVRPQYLARRLRALSNKKTTVTVIMQNVNRDPVQNKEKCPYCGTDRPSSYGECPKCGNA